MRVILLTATAVAALVTLSGAALAQAGPPHGHDRFFQFDTNNDGVVTRQEFDAGHTARFAALDADHNGQLSREEMRAGHQGRGGDGHRGRHAGGEGGHGLERADANQDGAITREEFLAHPEAMFARLDANNDGVISADERPQRGAHGERGQHGPMLDANNDGQISREEFAAMGQSMFERLDANHDGRVTRAEADAAPRGPGPGPGGR